MTDSELARRLGVDPSRLGKYIRDVHEPDLVTLLRICEVLGLTPNELLLSQGNESSDERSRLLALITGMCAGLTNADLEVLARMVTSLRKTPSKD